jgi:hypothetical protein
VPLPENTSPLTVRKPDGTEVTATGNRFAGTDQPGLYTISASGQRFAVNLAPEESRTSPLTPERFSSLGVPMAASAVPAPVVTPTSAAQLHDLEVESRQKPWRWLIAVAVGILFCETLLAAHLSSRSAAAAPQT